MRDRPSLTRAGEGRRVDQPVPAVVRPLPIEDPPATTTTRYVWAWRPIGSDELALSYPFPDVEEARGVWGRPPARAGIEAVLLELVVPLDQLVPVDAPEETPPGATT